MSQKQKNTRALVKRFLKERKGTAAIEFALVVPVFLSIVFAIFEIGYVFYVTAIIEEAASAGARLVRTDDAPSGGSAALTCNTGHECFVLFLCNRLSNLGDCTDKFFIEVKSYDTFADLNADTSGTRCPENTPSTSPPPPPRYETGVAERVIRLDICYLYNPIMPAFGLALANRPDGLRQILTSTIVKTEPFDDTTTATTPTTP